MWTLENKEETIFSLHGGFASLLIASRIYTGCLVHC